MGLLSGKRPTDLGVRDGKLKPAPSSPNCVSSQAPDSTHSIPPLTYKTTPEAALKAIAEIVRATPRTRIVSQTNDYLYAEYESALLGFVDDVEFWLPSGLKIVHVRSASRVGHSDFGVNRKRIEDVRSRLDATGV
jgi:uncharacterized protein (DUF1499 family)